MARKNKQDIMVKKKKEISCIKIKVGEKRF
jgi:hypothetical protein